MFETVYRRNSLAALDDTVGAGRYFIPDDFAKCRQVLAYRNSIGAGNLQSGLYSIGYAGDMLYMQRCNGYSAGGE